MYGDKTHDPYNDRVTYYASREAGAVVPFLQSVITGCLTAICISIGVLLISWKLAGWESFLWAAGAGAVTFALVSLLTWLNRQQVWREILWNLETPLGIDLDQDGQVGEPRPIQVRLTSEDGRSTQFAEIPGLPDWKLARFAREILEGASTAGREWYGTNGLFSQDEYTALRSVFVRKGWASWKNENHHQQGVEFNSQGLAVLRAMARLRDHSPTPSSLDVVDA